MRRHRRHSTAFKRRVVENALAKSDVLAGTAWERLDDGGAYRVLQALDDEALGRLFAAVVASLTQIGHEPPASLAAKKKPELVAHVVAILAEGATQGFADPALNARVNTWLPASVRLGQPET